LDLIPDIPLYLAHALQPRPRLVFGRLEFDLNGAIAQHVITS
jgi:hypothetical protein